MCSFLPLLLFSSLLAAAHSAVFFERQRTIQGREGQCYDQGKTTFYEAGEEMEWTRRECGRRFCRGSRGVDYVFVETQTCGKVGVPPGCHTTVDPELPYPNCCEKIVCKNATDSGKWSYYSPTKADTL